MEPILQSIFDSAVDGIIVIDARGLIKAFNPGAERLFGYSAEEVLDQNVKVLMPSPDFEQHDRYLTNYLETGVPRIIGTGREVRGRRKDGSTFPLHLSVGQMELDGQPAFTGILHDLSQRVAIEEALRKSEERVRSIVESAVDAIIVIDDRGAIQAFNPSAERLFGYRISEVLGRNVNMLMPSPDRERHDGYLHHYLTTGEQKIIGIGREVTARRKDGTTFPVHLSVGEMKPDDGTRSFTGILHDLSDRVVLEQRLTEQKSLAKLGEMAAVVAHEVKNPIAGIRGALQVITSRMPADQRDRTILIEIITRLDGLNRRSCRGHADVRTRAPGRSRRRLDRCCAEDGVAHGARSDHAEPQDRRQRSLRHRRRSRNAADRVSRTSADRTPRLLVAIDENARLSSEYPDERRAGDGSDCKGRGTMTITLPALTGAAVSRWSIVDPGCPPTCAIKRSTRSSRRSIADGPRLADRKRVVEAHGGTMHIDMPPEGGTTISVDLPLPA